MRCPTFAAQRMGAAAVAKVAFTSWDLFDNFNTGGLKDGKVVFVREIWNPKLIIDVTGDGKTTI